MHSKIFRLLLLSAALLAGARSLSAQNVGATVAGGPKFFIAAPGDAPPVRTDPSRVSALRTRISLDLSDVTLETALGAITAQSGMRIAYSRALVPLDTRVSLSANDISIAAALTEVLLDTRVDVLISRTGQITLTPREPDPAEQEPGTIVGRVTDVETGAPIVGVQILVDGRGRDVTDDDGRYRIDGVAPGGHTVSVTHIGYARVAREADVSDGETVTVDFAVEVSPSRLDEVVVTVTGEQRRRELGHVVGRINADSIVKEAPVSTLSELLNARVAGLQVFQNQGTVGGVVKLQVRGMNSVLLSSEPIVIVDGMRYTSGFEPWAPHGGGPANVEPTSPLNDLNPDDIESIEVVKGPSAATLYGTDAANGVIVITTKAGQAGPARWNAYANTRVTAVPDQHFQENYYAWGHRLSDGEPMSCSLPSVARGACAQDSVTVVPNPLNDPDWTMFESQPAWNYGLNVSGGGGDLRYFFASDFEDATGPIRMPAAVTRELLEQRGTSELAEEERKPNALSRFSLRANVAADLGGSAELRVNAGYVRGATRSLRAGANPYHLGAIQSAPNDPYRSDIGRSPANIFTQTSTERTDRFFGSANGRWQPLSWFHTRGTVGIDLSGRNRYSLSPPGVDRQYSSGAVADERRRQLTATADLGATATVRHHRLTFRTSVGAQYTRTVGDQLLSFGSNLPPGGTSVGEATSISAKQAYSEAVTLGGYVEETLGLNDRLFLTAALRADGASTFGQNYEAVVYPKAGLSWLVSEEPFFSRVPWVDELRLRYAFGASGLQPEPGWERVSYSSTRGKVDGEVRPMVTVSSLGNRNLRPERVREHEFGFDAAALQQRVRLGLTWYRRRTTDQIVPFDLGPGLGSIYTNLGLTTQHGFEAELEATLIQSRAMSFDVMLRHGKHSTKLEDLGEGGRASRSPRGGWVEGYPIGARFQRPIVGYEDTNGDGIITPDEIEYSTEWVYLGESTPAVTQVLTATAGILDRRIRLSALFERRSDFIQMDRLETTRCFSSTCRALVDRATPLAEQAVARAMYDRQYLVPESGDFIRFRELAVAVDLPEALTRPLGLRSATVSLAGRNLALWSSFSGPDPESAAIGGQTSADRGNLVSGGVAEGIPQGRSWSLRVDIGR